MSDLDAIVAFSPGEYFEIDQKNIQSFAGEVKCPVFISSAKNEERQWKAIYEAVTSEKVSHLPKTKGIHGSRGLWESTEGYEEAWKMLEAFFKKHI